MPAATQIVYPFDITVGGASLAEEPRQVLVSVTVDNSLNLPDLAVLEFNDPGAMLLGQSGLTIGSELRVRVGEDDRQKVDVFTGEITALEVDFDHGGGRSVVRAHDKGHRLLRGRRTKAWLNVTYSDIVREVAAAAGLAVGRFDATSTVHPHVSQMAVEDWLFLRHLADEVGYRLAVVDGKLEFTKPTVPTAGGSTSLTNSDPLTYSVGDEALLRVRVAMTSSGQVASTEVRGWDPKTKQAVVADASPATTSAKLRSTPASLASTFSAHPYSAPRNPIELQGEASDVAAAISGRLGGTSSEVEAEVVGNPQIHPGVVVNLGGVSAMLSGPYTVSATRHTFDHLGYRTGFVVSDRQDRSLLGLVGGGATGGQVGQISGTATAIVTNVNDTEGMCRVKVKFPWLSDTYESDWARTVQVGAGASRGFEILPEVNDEVLVAFEQGDFSAPVVLGGLYNGMDQPPEAIAQVVTGGQVVRRLFESRTGHLLVFDDSDANKGITVQTGDQTTKVVLEGDATNGVTVQSTKPITVKSDQTVTVQAAQDVTVKGLNVNVEAEANLAMKANAEVTIQGALVKISGEGPVQVQGAIIQLN